MAKTVEQIKADYHYPIDVLISRLTDPQITQLKPSGVWMSWNDYNDIMYYLKKELTNGNERVSEARDEDG